MMWAVTLGGSWAARGGAGSACCGGGAGALVDRAAGTAPAGRVRGRFSSPGRRGRSDVPTPWWTGICHEAPMSRTDVCDVVFGCRALHRPASRIDSGVEDQVSDALAIMIDTARRRAARDGDRQIDTAHLLHSLLESDSGIWELLDGGSPRWEAPRIPRPAQHRIRTPLAESRGGLGLPARGLGAARRRSRLVAQRDGGAGTGRRARPAARQGVRGRGGPVRGRGRG